MSVGNALKPMISMKKLCVYILTQQYRTVDEKLAGASCAYVCYKLHIVSAVSHEKLASIFMRYWYFRMKML